MTASAHKRARASVAVGALTMIFGALLAFAPGAAAEAGGNGNGKGPNQEGGDEEQRSVDVCHATSSDEKNPYNLIPVNISSSDGSLGNGENDHTGHSDDIIPPYTIGGVVFPGQNWTTENEAIWNNGCNVPDSESEEEATLTVVKVVTGAVPDDGWSFDFSVTDEADDVTLSGAKTDSSDSQELTVTPGSYDIVELDDGDATFVSFECTDDNADPEADPVDESADASDLTATVVLEDGDAVTCTFVNDFPEEENEEATLTVVKQVTGAVPAGGWSFDFSVTGQVDGVTLSGAGTDTSDSEDLTVTPGTYDIEELDDGAATFASFECVDDDALPEADPVDDSDDASDLTATVELADGDAVTCTFVNDFPEEVITETVPEIIPEITPPVPPVTPPVEQTPPVIDIGEPDLVENENVEVESEEVEVEDDEVPEIEEEDDSEVLGANVVRTLPRTGRESSQLALFGFALLLFGAVLTITSRRRVAVTAAATPSPRSGEGVGVAAGLLALGAVTSFLRR